MDFNAIKSFGLQKEADPHPAGIMLMKSGYYTIPSMMDLASMLDTDNKCRVVDFTVGRRGE